MCQENNEEKGNPNRVPFSHSRSQRELDLEALYYKVFIENKTNTAYQAGIILHNTVFGAYPNHSSSNSIVQMKKLLIIVNKHLQNYVANAIQCNIPKLEIIHGNVHQRFTCIVIEGDTMILASYESMDFCPYNDHKKFNISTASAADVVVKLVVEEYNKEDYLKEFVVGGHFNRPTMSLKFFTDKTTLDGKIISSKSLRSMCDAALDYVGPYKMGGNGFIMLTDNNQNKQYITRDALLSIRKWMDCNGR